MQLPEPGRDSAPYLLPQALRRGMRVLPASWLFYCVKRFRDRQEKGEKQSYKQAKNKVCKQKCPGRAAYRLQIQHRYLLPVRPPLGRRGERWGPKADEASVKLGGGCWTEMGQEGRGKWLPWARRWKTDEGGEWVRRYSVISHEECFEKNFFFKKSWFIKTKDNS